MLKRVILSIIVAVVLVTVGGCGGAPSPGSNKTEVNVAVEYTDHAAAFYYARGKGLFPESGFEVKDVKVYASGVGVAAAFARGGLDIGYMCLVPAIFTYANGGVPLKIIGGTHKDGYGLVVNDSKIKSFMDLERNDIRIANGPKGTTTDFLQMFLLEKENLDSKKILANTVRMNAAKQLMALYNGKVDAVFVPEHFATLAASFPGMKMLAKSRDIWPDMQGSVIVVSEDLIRKQPGAVEKLKNLNRQSIESINKNPREASEIIAGNLNISQEMIKEETQSPETKLEVTPQLVAVSMANLRITPEITAQDVQAVINKMYEFGYIEKSFDAREIMSVD
ncbi:MAG: ABC transporter substrate-binding protein [Firmicutes bacterium]|nr:ABC transporter substrate-binding protein [Bacillota bacterium]